MSIGKDEKAPCGVGLRITETAPFRVRECVAGGPAHESGRIRTGDILLAVDGAAVGHRPIHEVRAMIAGAPGSAVHMRFRRLTNQPDDAAGRPLLFDLSLIRRPAPTSPAASGTAAAAAAGGQAFAAGRRMTTGYQGSPARTAAGARSSWAAGAAGTLCRDLPPSAAITATSPAPDSDASR
jgi:hypothetical protein